MTLNTIANERVILIVDDNPINLKVIVQYLEDYNFEVIIARSGAEAIEKTHYVHPDLILLDVMMPPGMDGFEVCQRLKADSTTAYIPVIFMTALASAEDKVKGFEVGGVDYITKPLQQKEVLARIITHLHLKEQTEQLQQQTQELVKAKQISDSLREIANIINSSLDHNIVLDKILEQLGRVVYYDGASMLLRDKTDLVLSRAVGCAAIYQGQKIALNDSHVGVLVFKQKQIVIMPDVRADARWQLWSEGDLIRSWMGIPLINSNEAIGVLMIDSFQLNAYHEADMATLVAFANQAATAITNAHLYDMMQQANKELAKLNADKDKFFSIMAHDLRGPFLPLLGNLELMQEMAAQVHHRDLEEMSAASYRSARRVFELLGDLLQWARLQLGRIEYKAEKLSLHEAAQRTIALLADAAALKQITLHNQIPTDTMIYADKNMLDTVIRNLMNNALKFTLSGGQVTMSAQNIDEITPNLVEIAIADTGVGMSEEIRQKLFKLDEHVTALGTKQEKGTGLGLIICQEMVLKSGGCIWVESVLGQGTTVKFTMHRGV